MKTATIKLKTNQLGSTLFKKNVTPAEVMLLTAVFHIEAGGNPILELKEEVTLVPKLDHEGIPVTEEIKDKAGEVIGEREVKCEPAQAADDWTEAQEKRRLIRIYGAKKVDAAFPGKKPELPDDFDEAKDLGIETHLPEDRLNDVPATPEAD